MGADFNILEYADPDLDPDLGGGKTNILDLDDLDEQDEVVTKDDKQKKDVKEDEQKSKNHNSANVMSPNNIQGNSTNSLQTSTASSNVLTQTQNMAPVVAQAGNQQVPVMHSQAHLMAVQQSMYNHVQQAAANGVPFAPGSLIKSNDGIVGVVTSQNSVTVSYPAPIQHQQRMPQQHLQGNNF